MQKKILIVDDDKKLRLLLSTYLVKYGYEIQTLADGQNLLSTIRKNQPDLVVLDIMMPGKSGLELCKEIRASYNTPIIILSARGDVNDRIVGLELGADDYLSKPFQPRELIARIETIFRRILAATKKDVIRTGYLEIYPEMYSARLEGKELTLTTSEFEILFTLAKYPKRVFTRTDLMEVLRGTDWDAFNRSIDVLISRLRQKLGDDPKKPRYLGTVWGSGYKFLIDE